MTLQTQTSHAAKERIRRHGTNVDCALYSETRCREHTRREAHQVFHGRQSEHIDRLSTDERHRTRSFQQRLGKPESRFAGLIRQYAIRILPHFDQAERDWRAVRFSRRGNGSIARVRSVDALGRGSLAHHDGVLIRVAPDQIGSAQERAQCIVGAQLAADGRGSTSCENGGVVDDLQAALLAEAIQCVGKFLRRNIEVCFN